MWWPPGRPHLNWIRTNNEEPARDGDREHSSKAWGCETLQRCEDYGLWGQDQASAAQMSPEEDHRSLALDAVAKNGAERHRLKCGSEL